MSKSDAKKSTLRTPVNGVFAIASEATGSQADSLRQAIAWNKERAKSLSKSGKYRQAKRFDNNAATATLALTKLALEQASANK